MGGKRCDSTEDKARMRGQDSPGGERAQIQIFKSVCQGTWEFEDKHRVSALGSLHHIKLPLATYFTRMRWLDGITNSMDVESE